jgi:hypothetical protein
VKIDFVRLADHLAAVKNERDGDLPAFVILPGGTAADGSGTTKLEAGHVLEVHCNEFVRALLGRGELVRVPRPSPAAPAPSTTGVRRIHTARKED